MPIIEFDEPLDKDKAKARQRLVIWSVVAFVVAFVSIGLLIRFSGDEKESTWLCYNGEWVQVGHPIGPPPKRECTGGPDRDPYVGSGSGSVVSNNVIAASPGKSVAFYQKGNLVRGLPGLDPGKLYMAYDPSGVRTETVELDFDELSVCALGDEISSCFDARINSGLRVRVTGRRIGGNVLVQELESLSVDEF